MIKSYIIAIISAGILFSCAARKGMPVEEPVILDSPQLVNGQQVFMQKCNPCHPGGAAGLGPGINNKPLPGFMIKMQVRHGFGAMPAFEKEVISKEDLDDLVKYLKEIR